MGFCVTVLRPPLMAITKRDWRGGEHIPASGGCVLAVNHVSEFDPLPFAHFVYDHGRLPRFLGKAEVFKVPVIGRILTNAGQIPVYRKTADASKAFCVGRRGRRQGRVRRRLSRGHDLQGSRTCGRCAASPAPPGSRLTTGRPVIPCAQWGPQEILAPYARRPHLFPRKVMQIRAGAPVDLSDLQGKELTPELLHEATDADHGGDHRTARGHPRRERAGRAVRPRTSPGSPTSATRTIRATRTGRSPPKPESEGDSS